MRGSWNCLSMGEAARVMRLWSTERQFESFLVSKGSKGLTLTAEVIVYLEAILLSVIDERKG